jgi:hypothetical protein
MWLRLFRRIEESLIASIIEEISNLGKVVDFDKEL